MTETTATPEQMERRKQISKLTREIKAATEKRNAKSSDRNDMILAELESGTAPKEIVAITGLTIARIYAIRDKAKAKKEQG